MLCFTIPGPPVPNERARKGKGGHWYTPARTRAYRAHVSRFAHHAVARWAFKYGERWPMDATYRVTATFYMPTRRRADGDNLIKGVKDAVTGLVWDDDSQVKDGRAIVEHDRENPRAEVTVEIVERGRS